MSTYSPKSEALNALYWRSEILRLMYWLRGEGYGDLVDVPMLNRYLGVNARIGRAHLDQLVEDGLLVRDGTWFALSEQGLAEGEEEYLTAFSDLLKPAHGACSPECWCQMSAEEAEACTAQRERKTPHP
ncbi:MAG: hypothetical protein ACRD2W_22700 [Acidimicrobiales bacterium]